MKLELENFSEVGTGWYLRLDGECIAIIMPSDLPAIVNKLGTPERHRVVNAKVNEHYAQHQKQTACEYLRREGALP